MECKLDTCEFPDDPYCEGCHNSCTDSAASPTNPLDDIVSRDDLNLMRQWFDTVQDVNPKYLELCDYLLVRKIYEKLNMRVPQSIIDKCD